MLLYVFFRVHMICIIASIISFRKISLNQHLYYWFTSSIEPRFVWYACSILTWFMYYSYLRNCSCWLSCVLQLGQPRSALTHFAARLRSRALGDVRQHALSLCSKNPGKCFPWNKLQINLIEINFNQFIAIRCAKRCNNNNYTKYKYVWLTGHGNCNHRCVFFLCQT